MNILSLEMEAFGPFAQACQIDFRLSAAAGLFLIQGPTGAGKTSVLDAICFALYGESSGAERQAAGLRSHHVAENQVTKVSLVFSCANVEYRVSRSLAGRKSPQISEKASLEELRPQSRVLADKRPEVNQRISQLLHLDSSQFRQVIVLPQGRFRDFLVAKSGEREAILKSLFDTERLADLVERVAERRRLAEEDQKRLVAESGYISSGLGIEGIEDIQQLLAQLQDRVTQSESLLGEKQSTAQRVRGELEVATQTASLLSDFATAKANLAELDANAPLAERERLNQANRVAAYAHLPPQIDAAQRECAALASQARQLAESLSQTQNLIQSQALVLEQATKDKKAISQLQAEVQSLQAQAESLKTIRQIIEKQGQTQAEADRSRQALQSLQAAQLEFQQKQANLGQELSGLNLWAQLPLGWGELQRALLDLRNHLQNQTDFARSQRSSAALEATIGQQVVESETKLNHKRHAITALEAALAGQTALLLAKQLADGQPCPVCGSPHHPSPALAPSDAANPELLAQERAELANLEKSHTNLTAALAVAREKSQTAQQASSGLEQTIIDLRQHISALAFELVPVPNQGELAFGNELPGEIAAFCGDLAQHINLIDSAKLEEACQNAQQFTRRSQAAQANLGQLQRQSQSLHDTQRQNQDLIQERQTSLAVLEDRLAALHEQHQHEVVAFKQARPDQAGQLPLLSLIETQIRDQNQAIDRRNQAWEQAMASLAEAEKRLAVTQSRLEENTAQSGRVESQLKQAQDHWARAAAEAGFATTGAAMAAIMPEAQRQALQAKISEWDQQYALVSRQYAALAERCATLTRPDLPQLQAGLNLAEAELRQAVANLAIAKQDWERAHQASADLENLGRQRQENQAKLDLLTGLCRLLQGQEAETGYVNLQRYALSVYLDEILDHANRHLSDMSRGRYSLIRLDQAEGKKKTGGLELQIFDGYTGNQRGTESLSGGESFLAALALALGLSSVVHAQAGGVRIETLFIDEGFGSLDEEALQEAMGVLASLQERGRSVGIISHVRELQERIPLQLLVTRGPNGSQVRWNNTF